MTKRYRVVVVGAGKRGLHHAQTFYANPRFELVGMCDIDQARVEAAGGRFAGIQTGTDAAKLAASLKPDLFCFCTLPNLRLELVQTGIECGARLIAMEKPVALSSAEGLEIKKRVDSSGVKVVVSHQHRYGEHYQKVKEIIASGALGRINTVYGTATGWMMHMLSHLLDYMRWYNGEAAAEWVMAQAGGRGKIKDIHTSPDYLGGFVHFANGVHGIVECGAGAPDVPEVDYWWRKCRIGAQGTNGFAEVLTGNGYRAVTKEGSFEGPGCMNYDKDMPPYIQQMADWLDDDKKVHSCNFASAYAGFEIMMAMLRSIVEGGQVALPLTDGRDELRELIEKLPAKQVLLSMPANAKEYLGV